MTAVITPASEFWRSATDGLYESVPQSLPDWMDEHFMLSPDATASAGRWKCYPAQRGVAFFMSDLDNPETYIRKPAQWGLTQIVRAMGLYGPSHRGRNVGVWHPTEDMARWFSNLQIKSALRDCKAARDQLTTDWDARNSSNTTGRRTFKRGTLYCKGATSEVNFRGISVDDAIVDDLNGAPVGPEGTADVLAKGRLFASSAPKLVGISTPTAEGESRICQLLDETYPEHIFYWYAPCVHCGTMQQLVFGDQDSTHGMKWLKIMRDADTVDFEATAKTTEFRCCKCERGFGYKHLRDIDEQGEFRSTKLKQDLATGRLLELDTGNPVESPRRIAIDLCGTDSYSISWETGVYDFLKATDSARKGDPSALIQWQNLYMGEPSRSLGNDDLMQAEDLQLRAETYDCECPDGVQYITLGGDVGQDHIAYTITGYGYGYEAWTLESKRVQGSPVNDNLLDLFYQLKNRLFRKTDGSELPVSIAMIDTRYLGDEVRAVCRGDTQRMIPIHGVKSVGAALVKMKKVKDNKGFYPTGIGTQSVKDLLQEFLAVEEPGPGYHHFPDFLPEDFYQELCGEHKVTRYVSGQPTTNWQPRSRAVRVERLDTEVYCLAGMKLLEDRYNARFQSPEELARPVNQSTNQMTIESRASTWSQI